MEFKHERYVRQLAERRGNGFEIRVFPLSFAECCSVLPGEKAEMLEDYLARGGMPQAVSERDIAVRERYLKELFDKVYLKDIRERNKLRDDYDVRGIVGAIALASREVCDFGRGVYLGDSPTQPLMLICCATERGSSLSSSVVRGFPARTRRMARHPMLVSCVPRVCGNEQEDGSNYAIDD